MKNILEATFLVFMMIYGILDFEPALWIAAASGLCFIICDMEILENGRKLYLQKHNQTKESGKND